MIYPVDRAVDELDLQILGFMLVYRMTDAEILRLGELRARVRCGRCHEETPESKRLKFWQLEYEAGRLSDGEVPPEAITWTQMVDVTATAPPESEHVA